MTEELARKLAEQYQNGMIRTIALFKKSLDRIMETDEIEKIIKYAPRNERKELVIFREHHNAMHSIAEIPIWLTLKSMKSMPTLLVDVLADTIIHDDQMLEGEELVRFLCGKEVCSDDHPAN